MISLLESFIRHELSRIDEESINNYWLRRPRANTHPTVRLQRDDGTMSAVEDLRDDAFESVSDDFEELVTRLRHDIESARDIGSMEDLLDGAGFDAYDVVAEPTLFDRAVEDRDVETVRREILKGVERAAGDELKDAAQEGNDSHTLLGHPMRSVKGGGFSHKKPIGP